MKEIISAALMIVSIWGGTAALKSIHDGIRRAALEKAAQGTPSLSGFANALTSRRSKPVQSVKRPAQPGADSKNRTVSQETSKSK